MSSVSCQLIQMPVSREAEALARELAEARARERAEHVIATIDAIVARYGVTFSELSVALGVYAPPHGRSGRAMVARWRGGDRSPDDYYLGLLEMLADGRLVLELSGAEGSRKLFRVVPSKAAA